MGEGGREVEREVCRKEGREGGYMGEGEGGSDGCRLWMELEGMRWEG